MARRGSAKWGFDAGHSTEKSSNGWKEQQECALIGGRGFSAASEMRITRVRLARCRWVWDLFSHKISVCDQSYRLARVLVVFSMSLLWVRATLGVEERRRRSEKEQQVSSHVGGRTSELQIFSRTSLLRQRRKCRRALTREFSPCGNNVPKNKGCGLLRRGSNVLMQEDVN